MLHPLFLACTEVILGCSSSEARYKRRLHHLLSTKRIAYKRAVRRVEDSLPRRDSDACSTFIEHLSREYVTVTFLLVCRDSCIIREQLKRSVCDAELIVSDL